MTRPKTPIATPRFSTEKSKNSTVCERGRSIPAPSACIIRPINKEVKLNERKLMSEPTTKQVIAVKNSWRIVNLFSRNAETGMRIPEININMVVSHCAVVLERLKSCIISGKTLVRIVWFNTAINAPNRIILTMSICRRCDIELCSKLRTFLSNYFNLIVSQTFRN